MNIPHRNGVVGKAKTFSIENEANPHPTATGPLATETAAQSQTFPPKSAAEQKEIQRQRENFSCKQRSW
jgi:hypothetical protein